MSKIFQLLLAFIVGVGVICMMGCAQRTHISPQHGLSYQSYFAKQANAPIVRLAPTTAEDAKRISASRARRSKPSGSRRQGILGQSTSNMRME